ncbi:hypothetical protein FYJ75_04940 [Roseburia sp. MUC/MUC-530-WT-4D]|uniref:Uncharacterized protein n=1 Tax=Roseburia porci TaxID=2605790 RepID=A0A6L5YQJ7_9FIRM|nr:hypothetical protein [Roseburia porci]MCI5516224.1 hypothetical protein [Roseburia sp.]MDD6743544.1 hypothetical protein [Roseburia porci]MST74382.1 hypothetical protein [Roseburia porci]
MKNKKSGFWNFILSWIPGCSEMYMGFMKMGLSLMAVFWGIILASIVLNLGPLMFLAMIAWFYSFFHARNMYHMDDELFRVTEDRYLFDVDSLTASSEKIAKRYRKIIAIVLVVLGIVLVFRGLYSAVEFVLPEIVKAIYRRAAYYLPQVIVGIGIIAIGKVMLDGKKKELYGDDAEDRKQDGGVMQDGSEENNGTERNE